MTRPSDIPQDVWEAASELLYAVEAMPSDGNITVIARAILAAKAEERRQCIADLLELVLYSGKPGAVASNPYVDLNKAVAHLRKRGEG